MDLQEALEYLGISSNNMNMQEIRRRYSALLKTTHPEEDPDEFIKLSEAYHAAMEAVKDGIHPDETAAAEEYAVKIKEQGSAGYPDAVSRWMQQAAEIYEDLDRRKDIECWKAVFSDDVCSSVTTYQKAGEQFREFLTSHPYIPHSLVPVFAELAGVLTEGGLQHTKLDAGLVVKNHAGNGDDGFQADDYIQEYQRVSADYRSGLLSEDAYLHILEELASKGYESAYDLRDRIELCIFREIDGSRLVQRLLEVCSDFRENLEKTGVPMQQEDISLWQEAYGRAADLFYKGSYQEALEQLDAISGAAQLGIAEKADMAGRSLYRFRELIYEKQGRRIWQEFESEETCEAAKREAVRERREDEYYILCADYHYMHENYSECRKIAESLDSLWSRQKDAFEKKWGSALYAKRCRHNTYLIAQCALALSDYETAELYADMLLEEGENTACVYALHMRAEFFLNKVYEALHDYELITWQDQTYQDDSLALMAALLYVMHTISGGSRNYYYDLAWNTLERTAASVRTRSEELMEILQNNADQKPQALAYRMLCRFLEVKEDMEEQLASAIQDELEHWNPLLLYLYALNHPADGKKDILLYLYDRFGVYGDVALRLSMRRQHRYFEVDFNKNARDKALEYMNVQVDSGNNGYDRIDLARLLFRLKQRDEAYEILVQIPWNYRSPEVWYMVFQLSARTYGADWKKAFANIVENGCDTADIWYEYISCILFRHTIPEPFEDNFAEAEKCIAQAVEKFPEAEWKFLLIQSEIHMWRNEAAGALRCADKAMELAQAAGVPLWDRQAAGDGDDVYGCGYAVSRWKPFVEYHWNLLMLYRRLVYVNWISNDHTKAWELAAEAEARIIQYFGEGHFVEKLGLLADWWVYAARILMNHNLSKAEEYLKERMARFNMEKQVLSSPVLARAGLGLYKKRIMLLYLNDAIPKEDKKHAMSQLAKIFMDCFHAAYPEGSLEDYIQVKEELPKRMDEAGWYYMAAGNEYMAEQCFRKQISEPLCARCRGGCYKGYLNNSRMLQRNGNTRLAKNYYKEIRLPELCKTKLLR